MMQLEIPTNEKVIDFISERIRNQTYKEGDKLPSEKELSDMLSVSRNSVREALKTLQYLRLITSIKGSGYKISNSFEKSMCYILQFVFRLFNYTYCDISNIREGLELKSLLLIQNSKISSEDIKQLNEFVDNMEKGVDSTQNDLNFHLKLSELSNNNLIYRITIALSQASENYILVPWRNIHENEDDYKNLIKVHRDIIEWLEKSTKIIGDNPITDHYRIADALVNKTHNLDANVSLGYKSLNDLINYGMTENEIYEIVKKLKEKK